MQSMQKYLREIDRLQSAIQESEAICIGAGAGLSVSAGMCYSGERFYRYFSDFHQKYEITDIYSGGFYPFASLEEYWAWWLRQIYYNRYTLPDKPVYNLLYECIKDKEYFVLTTNVDHCFQRAGFDKKRVFYTQGNYGLLQCSKPCHIATYDNRVQIEQMLKEQKDMQIDAKLILYCVKCGQPMIVNLRCDNRFVQDKGWYLAQERYLEFVKKTRDRRILYLELGVGDNTPSIIKYPFWKSTYQNKKAIYAYINYDRFNYPQEIAKQTIYIQADIYEVFKKLQLRV